MLSQQTKSIQLNIKIPDDPLEEQSQFFPQVKAHKLYNHAGHREYVNLEIT